MKSPSVQHNRFIVCSKCVIIWKTDCFEKFLNRNLLSSDRENGVKAIMLLLAHLLISFSVSGRQNKYDIYQK